MKAGDKVVYRGCSEAQARWASCDDPRGVLEVRKVYTVYAAEVHSWHERVWLEGVQGHFNSVCFEIQAQSPDQCAAEDFRALRAVLGAEHAWNALANLACEPDMAARIVHHLKTDATTEELLRASAEKEGA